MKIKGSIAIYNNRYATKSNLFNYNKIMETEEKKKKTRKAIYWVASIAIAIATCVLSLLETSCCPHLIRNISDGYEKMYETIFYTTQDGDTTYYVTNNVFEKLKKKN